MPTHSTNQRERAAVLCETNNTDNDRHTERVEYRRKSPGRDLCCWLASTCALRPSVQNLHHITLQPSLLMHAWKQEELQKY